MAGLVAAVRARELGLEPVVHEAVEAGKPFIGICVGMQMLFDASEEAPGCKGLGIIPGEVRKLTTTDRLPHMGWNTLKIRTGSRLFDGLDDGAGRLLGDGGYEREHERGRRRDHG